ncbi:MAG: ribonuclease HII [Clostridia bacterium]
MAGRSARDFYSRERIAWRDGMVLAGVDEVGRGPLAGPVVAVALVLPEGLEPEGLDDSKVVPVARRLRLYQALQAGGAHMGVGAVGPRGIDQVNILQATRLAMWRALADLPAAPDWIVVDAMPLLAPVPVEALIHGDGRDASVAAASVVAKVLRDRYMTVLDQVYPGYGFAQNKGYGTREHIAALARLGPTAAHRRSFLPVGAAAAAGNEGQDPLL